MTHYCSRRLKADQQAERAVEAIIMSIPQLKMARCGTLGTERANIDIDHQHGCAERHYY